MTASITISDTDLLHTLCATSTALHALLDGDGRCHRALETTFSSSWKAIAIDSRLHDIFDTELADQHVAVIREALHSGHEQTLRFSVGAAEQALWYQATATPLDAALVLWTVRDITEQYVLEQAHARLQLFETLAERSLDGIAIADQNTVIIYANAAYQAMTGYGKQIIGTSFLDTFPPAERAYVMQESLPALMQHGVWQGTLRAQRPDGSAWTQQISTSMLPTTPDQPPLLAAIMRDVSLQQQAAQRLRLFELLVEKSTDGIAVTDLTTGTIDYMNPTYWTMLGFGNEVLGRPFVEFLDENPAYLASMMELVTEQGSWHGTITFKRANGTTFPGDTLVYLIPGTPEQNTVVVGIVRDLSEQQRQAAENATLQEQVIQAQQAALRELSTPLVPIAPGVVAMPLVGAIDSARVQQIMETLLEGIALQQVRYAILDITGVKIVDTQVASALVRVAQAAQLLGARVILTGIRPEVAQTLVQLGADLTGVITRGTVETGIAYALGNEAASFSRYKA